MARAFRVGIFVVAGLIALGIGVFLIGSKEFQFTRTYTLKTEFANVAGLNNGAEVRVGGIHEGTVRQINLPQDPNGKVTIVMTMDENTRKLIKKDSVAEIKTEGLLGDKFVEVSFGSEKSPEVASGDTIQGQVEKDVSEQAGEVATQAKAAVESFRTDMQALQSNFLLRGFFEKRGYNDPAELTRYAVSHMPKEEPSRAFEFDAKDLFDKTDNAKLKHEGKLDDAGKYLEENKFSLAIIAASTDLGDAKEGRTLTLARAKVVRDYLLHKFSIDDKHLKTIGLGKKTGEEGSKLAIYVYGAKPGDASDQKK